MKCRDLPYLLLFSFFFLPFVHLVKGQTEVSQNVIQAPAADKSFENLIHYGDLIDVDVVGSIEYDWRGTLNPEGFLNGLEFVEEPIYALCQSQETIAASIAKGYSKLLREPKIVVTVLDKSNRAVSVIEGAIKKPQRYQLKRAAFLNELLINSGGLTDKANGEIRIFRPQNLSCSGRREENGSQNSSNGLQRQKYVKTNVVNGSTIISIRISDLLAGKSDANPQIMSGDVVTVVEADPVYIIGGVNSPKQISLRSQLTVTRAIDSAGGISKDAITNSVTIFRRVNGETKIIEIDLDKIKKGQSEDPELQKFDIVDVAQKGRERKKYPPVIRFNEIDRGQSIYSPLVIIE